MYNLQDHLSSHLWVQAPPPCLCRTCALGESCDRADQLLMLASSPRLASLPRHLVLPPSILTSPPFLAALPPRLATFLHPVANSPHHLFLPHWHLASPHNLALPPCILASVPSLAASPYRHARPPPVSAQWRSLGRRQRGFYPCGGDGGSGGAAAQRRLFVEALNCDLTDCTFSASNYSPVEARFYIPAPISRGDGRRLMDGVDPGC